MGQCLECLQVSRESLGDFPTDQLCPKHVEQQANDERAGKQMSD